MTVFHTFYVHFQHLNFDMAFLFQNNLWKPRKNTGIGSVFYPWGLDLWRLYEQLLSTCIAKVPSLDMWRTRSNTSKKTLSCEGNLSTSSIFHTRWVHLERVHNAKMSAYRYDECIIRSNSVLVFMYSGNVITPFQAKNSHYSRFSRKTIKIKLERMSNQLHISALVVSFFSTSFMYNFNWMVNLFFIFRIHDVKRSKISQRFVTSTRTKERKIKPREVLVKGFEDSNQYHWFKLRWP